MNKLIVANWKLNPINSKRAEKLFNSIKNGVGESKGSEIVICPPFVYISKFCNVARANRNIKIGAQNCFWRKSGSFTGEISPQMLKDLGCQYVIIGHSERRKHLKETDEMVGKKVKAALEAGLKPILCIGETQEERKQNKIQNVLKQQLKITLSDLVTESLSHLVIVYEPVWAISATNGMAARPKDAKQAKALIQEILNKELSAEHPTILYGGSVDSNNAADYIKAGFQGLLVGGASLNAEEFIKIVKGANSSK